MLGRALGMNRMHIIPFRRCTCFPVVATQEAAGVGMRGSGREDHARPRSERAGRWRQLRALEARLLRFPLGCAPVGKSLNHSVPRFRRHQWHRESDSSPLPGWLGGLNPSTFGTLQRVYDPQSAFYESWQTSLPRPSPSRNSGHFPERSPASGSEVSQPVES